ncbi:hypothetical protein AB0346_30515, partial [Nocardia beijingensis]
MGQALRVDTDLLRALTPELAAIAGTAHEELARLKERLAAEGRCWGDDEPGRAFGDSYEPAAEKGITGFENLVHNLRGMSSSVADAGEVLHDQDQNIGSQLRTQNPFDSTPADYAPVGNPPYGQPVAQDRSPAQHPSTPGAAGPDPTPGATAPTSSDEPTAQSDPTARAADPTASASDPTAARGTEQPGYQPTGDPYSPGSMNPGDYGPAAGDADSPGQSSPTSNSTPSVQDRASPTSRNAAPTGRVPSAPATATPTAADSSPAATPKPAPSGPSAVPRTPETRWTRPPTESPWTRNAQGTPWSRNDGGRSPAQAFPPRRKGPRPDAKPVEPAKNPRARKPKPAQAKRSRVRTDPD